MRSTTFITNCWERDWDILLKTNFLKNKIARNEWEFTKKILLINNVKDRMEVEKYSRKRGNNRLFFLLKIMLMKPWRAFNYQKRHLEEDITIRTMNWLYLSLRY